MHPSFGEDVAPMILDRHPPCCGEQTSRKEDRATTFHRRAHRRSPRHRHTTSALGDRPAHGAPSTLDPYARQGDPGTKIRSEEHTSELQSHSDLVCRLLLEKKKKKNKHQEPQQNHHNTSKKQ